MLGQFSNRPLRTTSVLLTSATHRNLLTRETRQTSLLDQDRPHAGILRIWTNTNEGRVSPSAVSARLQSRFKIVNADGQERFVMAIRCSIIRFVGGSNYSSTYPSFLPAVGAGEVIHATLASTITAFTSSPITPISILTSSASPNFSRDNSPASSPILSRLLGPRSGPVFRP